MGSAWDRSGLRGDERGRAEVCPRTASEAGTQGKLGASSVAWVDRASGFAGRMRLRALHAVSVGLKGNGSAQLRSEDFVLLSDSR